jgi:DUF1365 family protein
MTRTALYRGRVSHARMSRTTHAFSYATYMLALDLDDLEDGSEGQPWMPVFGVERAAPLSFRRRDYRGDPARPLKEVIRDDVERELGVRPGGAVVLLTHVRVLGFVFNPVSFYYCYDADDALAAVVAEITNTPWGERHAYVLAAGDGKVEASFAKTFHVSPFMPMNQRYAWGISPMGHRVAIFMENFEDGARVFSAKLVMDRGPMTRAALARAALTVPLVGLKVLASIYWQALLLFVKGAPRFEHPRSSATARARRQWS